MKKTYRKIPLKLNERLLKNYSNHINDVNKYNRNDVNKYNRNDVNKYNRNDVNKYNRNDKKNNNSLSELYHPYFPDIG